MHGHLPVGSPRTLKVQFLFYLLAGCLTNDCCRLPGEGFDWSVSYSKPGDLGNSGHIVVIRKNRPWRIDIAPEGRILSTEEIQK